MAGPNKFKIDTAVIAAAGFGARLLPLTLHQSKPMMPIADRPLIHYIVDQIAAGGIRRFVVIINPKFQDIRRYIDYQNKQGEWRDYKFIIVEKKSKGFADSVLAAEKFVGKSHFIVAACDDIIDAKIPPFLSLIKIFRHYHRPVAILREISVKQISQYGSVAKFLDDKSDSSGDSIIDKVNYFQNKKIIDRLSNILDSAKKLGLIVSLVLALVSILVTFNTIRLTIYSSRDEIEVMRLVGASNRFASGPFIVEGAMYGFFSALIAMIIFYPIIVWVDPKIASIFSGVSLFRYYTNNFGQIFAILLGVGVLICSVSSLIAVRRYLKI